MFTFKWDDSAWEQSNAFLSFADIYDRDMQLLAHDLAKQAEEYFKPYLKGVRTDPAGTGDTERSLKTNVVIAGEGFDITWEAYRSAEWLDVGNWSAGAQIYRTNQKPYPVDKRFDSGIYAQAIYGMGHYTTGAVSHYSEKTVHHLVDNGIALEAALKYFAQFLSEVVIKT